MPQLCIIAIFEKCKNEFNHFEQQTSELGCIAFIAFIIFNANDILIK